MSLAESFKALSDPQRRQVLTFLRGGRKTAGEIAEALGVSASSLSYHLNALKRADMIIEYKVKNYVYYALNTTLFDEMLLWMDQFRKEGTKNEQESRDNNPSGAVRPAVCYNGDRDAVSAGQRADALRLRGQR